MTDEEFLELEKKENRYSQKVMRLPEGATLKTAVEAAKKFGAYVKEQWLNWECSDQDKATLKELLKDYKCTSSKDEVNIQKMCPLIDRSDLLNKGSLCIKIIGYSDNIIIVRVSGLEIDNIIHLGSISTIKNPFYLKFGNKFKMENPELILHRAKELAYNESYQFMENFMNKKSAHICPHCGEEITGKGKFCANCGSPLA